MTKKDIAKNIAEETGVTNSKVQEIVQRVLDGIIEVLVTEGRIELRNFGVFQVVKRKARKCRNPRTGEAVFAPECRKVKFKPGLEIEKKVEGVGVKRLKICPRFHSLSS